MMSHWPFVIGLFVIWSWALLLRRYLFMRLWRGATLAVVVSCRSVAPTGRRPGTRLDVCWPEGVVWWWRNTHVPPRTAPVVNIGSERHRAWITINMDGASIVDRPGIDTGRKGRALCPWNNWVRSWRCFCVDLMLIVYSVIRRPNRSSSHQPVIITLPAHPP